MDIFNSQWLLNMLAKSSKSPQGRILSLFDILSDWLSAPDIHVTITKNATPNEPLIAFLTEQATACGAENPNILAEHIALIARNAALQELNQPNNHSLAHAKKVADALILAQTQKDRTALKTSRAKPAVYGIAASLLVAGIATAWLVVPLHSKQHQPTLAINANKAPLVAVALNETNLSAQDAVTMYAKYEQIRNGTCQFPEALLIPDKDKAVYLENVVAGNLPSNLNDLATANSYLEKVRCNFTPMLMANSTS
jgi:hypothetical protein